MHTVMDAIWRRMAERDKNWRFAYKSLLLIDYILRNGAEQVIPECRRHSYDIQALMSFNYMDENDKDQGINGDLSLSLHVCLNVSPLWRIIHVHLFDTAY